ncbi:MAG TPA: DUF5317 family protein [Actinomycetota bacterium]
MPLFGGRLSLLADAHVRLAGVLPLALALQVLAVNVPGVPQHLRPVLQVASYPVGLVFVAANWRLAGIPLVGLGALGNLAAILANGGTMPATAAALASAGLAAHPHRYANSAAVAHPRLAFLGDLFSVPRRFPLHNVFSVGDLLIALGVVVAVHALCGSRPRLRLRGQRQKA